MIKILGKGFMQVQGKDAAKSLIIFALTPLIMSIATGNIPMTMVEAAPLLKAGISAAAAYIVKNFLTNSNDEFLKKDETK
jgi:hypothetical protein